MILSQSISDSPRRSTKPATRKKGDIELLELIAKNPQAFILKQGWASVSLDGARGLMELRSLYGHLQRHTRSETLPSTACGETPQPRRTSR